MKMLLRTLPIAVLFVLSQQSLAAEFKPYPAAKVDEKATRAAADAGASRAGFAVTIYTTNDPFAKVAAFYKGLTAEYVMPGDSGSSGKPKKWGAHDMWEAYFIFDGAKDLGTSRHWVKVQRPAIALYPEEMPSQTVRDITVIIQTQKKQ